MYFSCLSWISMFTVFVVAGAASTTRSPDDGEDERSTTVSCTRRYVNENGRSISEQYECPEYDDSSKTLCCDKTTERCCLAPKEPGKFYELPQTMAIIISVSVVFAAVVLTGVLIMCCCWEKCPLYMACRAEAKPDYIAKPDDVAGLSLMPDDNVENAKMYEPGKAAGRTDY